MQINEIKASMLCLLSLFLALAGRIVFNENAILLLCGLLGVLGHCLFKLDSLKKSAKSAKIAFSFKDYIEQDLFSILFSLVSVFIWLLVFEQTATVHTKIVGYSRLSFVGCGWMGSYIIQYLFSSAEKKIKSIIDEKTNTNETSS